MPKPRRSAAVMLTRGRGEELEVYLVERSPHLSAFAGYWAMPGGVVDAGDRLHSKSSDDEQADREALERCALRELFEETGVLVPPLPQALQGPIRAQARNGLLAHPPESTAWRAAAGELEEARRQLRRFCRVTTPPFGPRRYANVFFHLELPSGEQPSVQPGELVRGRFIRPSAALAEWRAGSLPIVPPVRFLLEALATGSLAGARTEAARVAREMDEGVLHPVHFSPGIALAPLRTPTLPPATTTNCVLIGEERIYIVDPATYEVSERERLFGALDRLQAAGRRLEGILLTHHHRDHIGAVEQTAQRYGLPVLAHPETLQRVPLSGVDARELHDGDELELGTAPDGRPDWHLRSLHTPGHAPGHLAFVEDRYRAAVVGDLISTLSTIVIDPEDGHLVTYLASLRRLLAERITSLHPAHGPAVPDGPSAVRRYLDHRLERERALHAALEAGLGTIEELVPVVYSDTPPALHSLAGRSLLSGLIKLEEEGRAELRGARWHPVPVRGS